MISPLPPLSVRTYCVRNLRKILPLLIILTFVVMLIIVVLSALRGMKEGALVYADQFRYYSVLLPKKAPGIPKEIRLQIENHPTVDRVVDARNCFFRLRALIASIPFAIRAVRQEDMRYMMKRFEVELGEGRFPKPGTSEVILHEDFLKANDWTLGSEFGMKISDDDWMPGRWEVVGVLTGKTQIGFASYEFISNISLFGFAKQLRERQLIFAKEGKREEMNSFLHTFKEVRTWDLAAAEREIGKSFDRLLLIVDFLCLLQIIVVALVVGLINNIFFGQRTDEFAILLAVGYTQKTILKKVSGETAGIMITAWILGTGLSIALLALFRMWVLTPRGIALPILQTFPILISGAMPIIGLLFSSITVIRKLRKFDPIQVIERRG